MNELMTIVRMIRNPTEYRIPPTISCALTISLGIDHLTPAKVKTAPKNARRTPRPGLAEPNEAYGSPTNAIIPTSVIAQPYGDRKDRIVLACALNRATE